MLFGHHLGKLMESQQGSAGRRRSKSAILTYMLTANLCCSILGRRCDFESKLLTALPVLLLQLNNLLLKVLGCEVAACCQGKFLDTLQQSGLPNMDNSHHILSVLRKACARQ